MKYFFLFSIFIVLNSCKCSGGKNRTDAQWTRDMSKQHNVKAQEGTSDRRDLNASATRRHSGKK